MMDKIQALKHCTTIKYLSTLLVGFTFSVAGLHPLDVYYN